MNFQKMLEDARRIQEEMSRTLDSLEVEGAAGGGMVRVRMNGRREVLRVRIDPAVVDSKDMEMLEDLVRAAFLDAGRRLEEAVKSQVQSLGLPPGLLG